MNSPKIRFKGYTEDWEQRKLGEIITEYKETVDSECTLPILTSSKTEGVILQEEHFGRKQQHDITGYNILPRNYCTYRNRSDGVDFTFNINKCCDKGIISKFYPVFSGKNSDVFFLSLVLNNSDGVVREIAYTCTGTGQKVLSFLDLQKMKVRVPSYDEQKEIAAYFENLDHLITLHQRKCEQTKTLKKYMLQKMFPQEGQKVPEIRFEGFTGDWEQRKLDDVTVKIGSGKTPSGGENAYVDAGIPLIRSQNVNDNKVDFEDIVYIDESTDKLMMNSRVFANDVLLNITGASIGRSAVYKGLDEANVNQHVCIIRPIEGYHPDFIQLNLASDRGQKQIKSSQAGGGREGLNFQQIGKMEFVFPTLDEQKQIGNYFNNIDHLITLHQREYEKLQELKKFMLQNMFV